MVDPFVVSCFACATLTGGIGGYVIGSRRWPEGYAGAIVCAIIGAVLAPAVVAGVLWEIMGSVRY